MFPAGHQFPAPSRIRLSLRNLSGNARLLLTRTKTALAMDLIEADFPAALPSLMNQPLHSSPSNLLGLPGDVARKGAEPETQFSLAGRAFKR